MNPFDAPATAQPGPSATGATTVTLRFTWDAEEFARLLRWQRRIALRRAFRVLAVVVYGGLASLGVAVAILSRQPRPLLAVAGLLAWLAVFWLGGGAIARRRFRRSPYHGIDVVVTVDDEGIATESAIDSGRARWAAFTRAHETRDGVVLVQGGIFRWLPFDAIVDGAEAGDLLAIVRRHVRDVAPLR